MLVNGIIASVLVTNSVARNNFNYSESRNPLKMLFYSTVGEQYSVPWMQQSYNGPDDCIADILLEKYLNNPLVCCTLVAC